MSRLQCPELRERDCQRVLDVSQRLRDAGPGEELPAGLRRGRPPDVAGLMVAAHADGAPLLGPVLVVLGRQGAVDGAVLHAGPGAALVAADDARAAAGLPGVSKRQVGAADPSGLDDLPLRRVIRAAHFLA